jgi:hypothetical protein
LQRHSVHQLLALQDQRSKSFSEISDTVISLPLDLRDDLRRGHDDGSKASLGKMHHVVAFALQNANLLGQSQHNDIA